jgi:hypothetical protein
MYIYAQFSYEENYYENCFDVDQVVEFCDEVVFDPEKDSVREYFDFDDVVTKICGQDLDIIDKI